MEEKKAMEFQELMENISDLIKKSILKNFPEIDHSDIEDIEQEVKIKFWGLLSSGKNINHFYSYLRRVVYTTTIDLIRKRMKMDNEQESNLDLKTSTDDSPDFINEKRELRLLIDEAINSLSENRKMVLKLYLTDMNINEISNFLNPLTI